MLTQICYSYSWFIRVYYGFPSRLRFGCSCHRVFFRIRKHCPQIMDGRRFLLYDHPCPNILSKPRLCLEIVRSCLGHSCSFLDYSTPSISSTIVTDGRTCPYLTTLHKNCKNITSLIIVRDKNSASFSFFVIFNEI